MAVTPINNANLLHQGSIAGALDATWTGGGLSPGSGLAAGAVIGISAGTPASTFHHIYRSASAVVPVDNSPNFGWAELRATVSANIPTITIEETPLDNSVPGLPTYMHERVGWYRTDTSRVIGTVRKWRSSTDSSSQISIGKVVKFLQQTQSSDSFTFTINTPYLEVTLDSNRATTLTLPIRFDALSDINSPAPASRSSTFLNLEVGSHTMVLPAGRYTVQPSSSLTRVTIMALIEKPGDLE